MKGTPEQKKRWRSTYREKYPDKIKAQQKKHNLKKRMMVLEYYSGKIIQCACCGEKEIKFLSIDHINNDGAEFRRTSKGRNTNQYTKIIKMGFPEGLQILCYNCNCSKGFYGKCPHIK